MRSFVSESSLAEYYNFLLRLVIGQIIAEELERKRLDGTRNLVFL